ncbi:alpha/beta hydrolase [Arsenicicoccus piscis]|uniref:Peptidase n=1 Tax=Arsenicicoccus piscis TaxID=673954 RepID=A0ABQ6HRM0_9MICO|nr:alpha/beta hydrolase [Arsenicicoccus piscis]MCH8626472.1 alpha/beta hydrolase [Arsenicicoccus piscis]GMA21100.1 peptidase [Arsenicicoccus piscis]
MFRSVRRPSRVLLTGLTGTVLASLAVGLAPPVASASDAVPAKDDPGRTARIARAKAAATTPKIVWKRCMTGYQCGSIEAPLDYADYSLGTITIDLARRPADKQSQKVGAVFTNPGGPGGSAVYALPMFAQQMGADVRARLDLLAVEPRGLTQADPAICTSKTEPPMPTFSFPVTAAEQEQALAYASWLRKTCSSPEPRILDHMSTADSARDLDLVRRAIGQPSMTYYGVSYGSYLGATYANLFPSKVRAVAVDGVLDPVAWSTGRNNQGSTVPVTERIRSHIGAQEALTAAFTECERVRAARCPEHQTIRADYAALQKRLKAGPVMMGEGENTWPLTYDSFINTILGALYDADSVPELITAIHDLRVSVLPDPATTRKQTPAQARAASATARKVATTSYQRVQALAKQTKARGIGMWADGPDADEPQYGAMVAFEGVLCSDSLNPQNARTWIGATKRMDSVAPGFGSAWGWASVACPGWPGQSRSAYYGPFTTKPAKGLLVLSTTHDPATPLSGAQALRALSPGSRLVTVKNWGHSAFTGSTCAAKIRNTYLLTGALPSGDRTCAADHPLFTTLQ